MKRQTVLSIAIAALFAVTLGVNTGFAQKTGDQEKDSNSQSEQNSGSSMSGHEGIESGRDFGEHVSSQAGNFSGDHNPGNHKGYSSLKD